MLLLLQLLGSRTVSITGLQRGTSRLV